MMFVNTVFRDLQTYNNWHLMHDFNEKSITIVSDDNTNTNI